MQTSSRGRPADDQASSESSVSSSGKSEAKLESPPPIVMITTEGSEEVINEAVSRGAKGYLQKPFTPEKIQEVIGPFLG
mgnify:CR=1 FL=1